MPTLERSKEGHDPLSTKKKRGSLRVTTFLAFEIRFIVMTKFYFTYYNNISTTEKLLYKPSEVVLKASKSTATLSSCCNHLLLI